MAPDTATNNGLVQKENVVSDRTPVSIQGRRATKFTPERIEQIRNLVERGHKREEIAEIIGVTVGSLQVTCSKLGISLRRPRLDNGVGLRPRPPEVTSMQPKPKPPISLAPQQNGGRNQFSVKLEYNDRSVSLPLDSATMVTLILKAEVRGERIADALARAIREFVERP